MDLVDKYVTMTCRHSSNRNKWCLDVNYLFRTYTILKLSHKRLFLDDDAPGKEIVVNKTHTLRVAAECGDLKARKLEKSLYVSDVIIPSAPAVRTSPVSL
jgi:hypothetical protein